MPINEFQMMFTPEFHMAGEVTVDDPLWLKKVVAPAPFLQPAILE